jgi:hypothetical protein
MVKAVQYILNLVENQSPLLNKTFQRMNIRDPKLCLSKVFKHTGLVVYWEQGLEKVPVLVRNRQILMNVVGRREATVGMI